MNGGPRDRSRDKAFAKSEGGRSSWRFVMKHDFPFDPTGGYSAESLILGPVAPLPTEPADFVAFWQATFAEAMAVPLDWRMEPSASHQGNAEWEVFDVSFAGMAGAHRVGGWLVKPRGRPVRRGLVWGHGYGGRGEPQFNLPADDMAAIFPVCTGLPTRSPHPTIGDNGGSHVISGIDSRETYSHRYSVMDIWRAASVLLEAVPETRARLDYRGGSFGGGIGALALPWDNRFVAAHLTVPSFGNHDIRLGLQCTGSGESVRQLFQKRPEIRSVLAYFDSAVAATHIRIPVHVGAAVFDPAVIPPGQFAVYHALGGRKRLFVLSTGHFDHAGTPAENERMEAELREFFAS